MGVNRGCLVARISGVMILWVLMGCGEEKEAEETSQETGTPPTTGTTSTTSTTGTTGTTGTTTKTEEVDCSVEPVLPFVVTEIGNFGSAEDFDFDADGFHGSVEDGNLLLRSKYGDVSVLYPGLGTESAGTRQLPNGDWVIAIVSRGTLVKVNTKGMEVLLSDLAYPNGVEVTPDGYVYVSENNGGRVRRVHSETGESMIVAEGLVGPNGLIETVDGETLYVGTCPVIGGDWTARIYAIHRTGPDSWAEPEVIMESPDWGCIDGITVDACGRLYYADFGPSDLWRVDLDKGERELAAELPGFWVPNLRWGPDIGGWGSTVIYATDRERREMYSIETNLPGKPHIHRP
jgi:sugar lactone lactonase YvrE